MLNMAGMEQIKPLIEIEEVPRFGQESTKTLIFYMISALSKIQALMEVFERFSVEGSTVTLKLCLTNARVAEQVRELILNYYRIDDPYLESLQNTIPEILSYPNIIFHGWEQKT